MRLSTLFGILIYLVTVGCISIDNPPEPIPQNDFKVHAYYVIPADQAYSNDNASRVFRGILETQRWFQTATGGLTFELLDEENVIEVYVTEQPLEYYADDWWGLLLTEMRKNGHPVESPGSILMVWVEGLDKISEDVYSLGGWSCDGTCGAAILPISSLQGPTLVPTDMGVVFHELGHALQLTHPVEESDLPLNSDAEPILYSVMCQGNIRAGTSNTDHGFLTSEKAALSKNKFMKQEVELRQDIWLTRIINYPITGLEPDPVIQYEREGNTRVNFTTNIDNGLYYYWYFGDGTTSSERSPKHTYELRATYNVTLMVTTDSFMAARTNQFIIVD